MASDRSRAVCNSKSAVLFSPVQDPEMFNRAGFYVDDLRIMRRIFARVKATNSLRDIVTSSYDVILGYFYTYSVLAAIIARLRGKRVILTGGADNLHAVVQPRFLRRLLHKSFFFVALLIAHRILAVSKADQLAMVTLAPTSRLKRKIVLSYHAIDVTRFLELARARKRRECMTRVNGLTFCWMGSVENVRRKGICEAIDVVAEMVRQGAQVELTIVGTLGPGTLEIEKHVSNLGLHDAVRILGAVNEVEKDDLFRQADIYFQLSTYEGFGVAALEATLSGALVCHTGAGGLADSVGDLGFRFNLRTASFAGEVARLMVGLERFRRTDLDQCSLSQHAQHFTFGERALRIEEASL